AFGYGLMVTPLQLAHVYATIGSFGIYRPLSITKVDPPVIGTRVMPEELVHEVEHMMESVALPGGGGTKAAVRDYRIAVKTGTAKKIGDDGKYVDKYVAYTAGVAPASNPRFALVVVINNPQNGAYYGGAVSAPVFSQIMGDVLRLENVEPDGMPADSDHLLVMHGSHVAVPGS
ncbi:penicillin-binding transpeptidase domain-containing protein, partial [Salmonella enterica]|nr:peptidoglycan synthase [Salmonella enterica subsp. enterica serovar Typhi str. AG3]